MNEWHSVAIIFDGDEQIVYVDGELADAETVCKWIKVTGPGTIWVEVDE